MVSALSTRIFALLLAPSLFLAAAEKKVPSNTRGENEDLILNVTLYDDPALVKDLLGTDLQGHFIVAAVKLEPKYGKDVIVDRDDFQLRTNKDGEHTTPFAPSQIVASDAVTVSQSKGPPAASPGMVLGGPLVIHGGALAKAPAETNQTKTPDSDAGKKEDEAPKKKDPLKELLEQKALPEVKTGEPVSGLLYFPMDRQKRKDLELVYGGRENRITLKFK